MKKFILFISFVFLAINLVAQTEPAIKSTLQFTNGLENRFIHFGIDPTATDGIDEHLGEADLPPFPPPEVIEIRFNLPEGNFSGIKSSYKDYRSGTVPFSGQVEHRLRLQKGSSDSLVIIWALPAEISCELKDLAGGVIINVQMTGEGNFNIPNPGFFEQLQLIVNYNNATSLEVDNAIIPESTELLQNYPNPFNPSTNIRFNTNEASDVVVEVFDVLGNKVSELVNGFYPAGSYSVSFNASELTTGIYFYQLRVKDIVKTRKMTLIK
jgi:hypothetical protein